MGEIICRKGSKAMKNGAKVMKNKNPLVRFEKIKAKRRLNMKKIINKKQPIT